jgi:hypothetical protein
MRTTPLVMAAAAAIGVMAPFVLFTATAPSAQACNPVPIPALGINADCGYQAAQCGVSALTGVGPCPGGMPAAVPGTPGGGPGGGPGLQIPQIPATQQTPGLPQMQIPAMVPQAPAPNDGPPIDPGQCANLDYYIQYKLSCAAIAPPPPGFHLGMGS